MGQSNFSKALSFFSRTPAWPKRVPPNIGGGGSATLQRSIILKKQCPHEEERGSQAADERYRRRRSHDVEPEGHCGSPAVGGK